LSQSVFKFDCELGIAPAAKPTPKPAKKKTDRQMAIANGQIDLIDAVNAFTRTSGKSGSSSHDPKHSPGQTLDQTGCATCTPQDRAAQGPLRDDEAQGR
jgi:hypothetical protein